ncbi:PrsW family glutamic-type intramembrane protease [uncultured Leifsonia sp.]|uniref:PrsW family glutamic-type intramembrane protease n=1 Tax=uncultured Leifsonia sp. TaxID=340359 RepID=UPI0025E9A4AF|nr:PrsW family glutamic-type intramembrane protease [uncultured Leifsonia sp.]
MTYAPSMLPPSGWYPDPYDPGLLRWWSGVEWTGYTYPVAPAAAPQEPRAPRKRRAPRKWLGRFGGWIIAGVSAGIWLWVFGFSFLLAAIAPHARDGGPSVVPTFLLLSGAATVAVALLYTMAYKLRPDDELSAPRLLLIGGVGGLAAALVAAPANALIDVVSGGTSAHPSELALLTAGVVEETVKLAAVLLLAMKLPVKDARIGLFVGGAVGIGFSVIENVGYLLDAFARGQEAGGNGIGYFIVVTIGRQLTGPFLHPVFSALVAAAVFAAAKEGRYRLSLGAVLAYLGVVAAHGGFDGFIGFMQNAPMPAAERGGLLLIFEFVFVVASGITWLLVAQHVRRTGRTATLGSGAAELAA